MQALGSTALIFFALSGYVLTSRKDFSFMGGFLMAVMIAVIIAMIANIFLQIPTYAGCDQQRGGAYYVRLYPV